MTIDTFYIDTAKCPELIDIIQDSVTYLHEISNEIAHEYIKLYLETLGATYADVAYDNAIGYLRIMIINKRGTQYFDFSMADLDSKVLLISIHQRLNKGK